MNWEKFWALLFHSSLYILILRYENVNNHIVYIYAIIYVTQLYAYQIMCQSWFVFKIVVSNDHHICMRYFFCGATAQVEPRPPHCWGF
jgi:hypothetical protein